MSVLEYKILVFTFLFSVVSVFATLFIALYHTKNCAFLPDHIERQISITQGCLVKYHDHLVPVGSVNLDLQMK